MSSEIERAAREAVEAADSTEVARQIAAILAAQQLLNAQQPAVQQPQQPFDSRKWVTIGGLAIAGGLVASLFAVAVAIGAVSVAILALVLRSIWSDIQKGR